MMLLELLNGRSKLAVIGLGYVGLPLAVAFSKKLHVVGYDTNNEKIDAYNRGIDPSGELHGSELEGNIVFSSDESVLEDACFFIIAVPTPVYPDKRPNLEAVEAASKTVAKYLREGSIVVFESTMYPGVTEEVCAPILEEGSGLVCGRQFKIGYSPERINPSDKVHKLNNIVKVVSGMDAASLDTIAKVYELIIDAGVYRAGSIKGAEAIKLVENIQRDVNVALMNEFAMYFDLLSIDTGDVISGMKTKWNALNFVPGLVGGHCIGVDPYYFIYQAEKLGYDPNIILGSRKLNDSMGSYIVDRTVRELISARKPVRDAKVYVLGGTFKENCADIRNAKTKDIIQRLRYYDIEPLINDPCASPAELDEAYGCTQVELGGICDADCVIFAVAHDEYRQLDSRQIDGWYSGCDPGTQKVLIDIKRMYGQQDFANMGYRYWAL